MRANSRPVRTSQQLPHPRLAALAARHAGSSFRKPPAPYSRDAFARLLAAWDGRAPLVLDAGCGTGASTLTLARRYPQSLVVGVDQSAARLAQGTQQAAPANALLLRADVVDIWLLLAERRMRLARHYLLYPNPWPKPAQVMRRWPAHPLFPALLGLGGVLECRSNWRVYIEEFALAVQLAGGGTPDCGVFVPEQPLTPFERKYRDSGHPLYRAAIDLDQAQPPALNRAAAECPWPPARA
jgi:tRNA (guanine-N7-)-methyltransferase